MAAAKMYPIYSALLALAAILSLPYWVVQGLRFGKYRAGILERLGRLPGGLRETRVGEKCIWVHAVSVGEVLAVAELITALRNKLGNVTWRIVVSTTTKTGQALAREKFGKENVFYLPLDWSFALESYFIRLRPRLLILAETEFWPNLLRIARSKGALIAVVNARISDRSFPRYKSFKWLFERVLENVDLFLAQSDMDAERLIQIGASKQRVQVSGNLKFDARQPARLSFAEKLRVNADPVLIFGSTVEGEEEILLPAIRRILSAHPKGLIILAPRHPERFLHAEQLLKDSGLRYWRRSAWHGEIVTGGVFLLDTIGELASCYAFADAAFVGGSLVPRGGHNILEPAQFGLPIFVGPHTENFREVVDLFKRAAAVQVIDPSRIELEVASMAEAQWKEMGARAKAVFQANAGATQKSLDAIQVLLWMPSSIKPRYQQEVR